MLNIKTIAMSVEISLISTIVLVTIYHLYKYTPARANKAPAFLTTLGILGTFSGITIGLLDFDTNNIQQSVPSLIDGIKTAFIVSTAGILGAILVKIRDMLNSAKSTNATYNGATVNDLADLLNNIKKALVDNDESTLLGQTKLARQESNDKIIELKKSLDAFCEKVADNNSKALIDALKEVIKDFNSKINDQFGENFKHLNQAVGKTLEWQEQYRLQISEMIEQQTKSSNNMIKAADAMSIATDRYTNLVNQTQVFNTTASNLSTIITSLSDTTSMLDIQRHQIEESIRSLAVLINAASTGLPKIEENITSITNQLNKSVQDTADKFNSTLISNIHSSTQKISDDIKEITSQLSTKITEFNDEFRSLMLNTMQITNQEINTNLQKVNKEISTNITQLIGDTKEQVIVLDTAISTGLTKCLETFGRQLTSLSQKFADDYTPLTNKLKEVLGIARGI